MPAGDERKSQETNSTNYFESTIATGQTSGFPFGFAILPVPEMRLTFPSRPLPRPRKRSRAVADIDGDHSCIQKKKRRLRLFLITSRLSPQFSHPATNIVDRGSSKIAVWAKQKSLGRNLLRKAAILNGIRRRALLIQEEAGDYARSPREKKRDENEMELAKLEFNHGSVDTYTRPVTSRTPSVPPAAAVRTGGRFVVSGSPTGSPSSSRSPSPTSPSQPPKIAREESNTDYRSPNEAYINALPCAQIPRREYIPLPPSPLGLSNYDAFDADDMPDPYSHLDDEENEPSRYMFDEEEDEEDSVPFSPSAVTSTSSSTLQTRASHVLKTPPQITHSDFSVLDHNEPVFGDYDQVDEGADTVWPSTFAQEPPASTIGSTSPDFHALFATALPPKRSDSFATSPNFRPTRPKSSVSPDFPPTTSIAPNLPNFAPTLYASPNFTPSSGPMSVSPNFSALSATPTTSVSPNFAAIDAPSIHPNAFAQRRMSLQYEQRPDDRTRRNSDVDEERKRQRDLMFAHFQS
jgi:hypothetical protein